MKLTRRRCLTWSVHRIGNGVLLLAVIWGVLRFFGYGRRSYSLLVCRPQGAEALISVEHRHVFLWNYEDNELVEDFNLERGAMAAAFSQDGTLLAVGDLFSKVHIWDLEHRRKILEVPCREWIIALGFNSNKSLTLVSLHGAIQICELDKMQWDTLLEPDAGSASVGCVSPDGGLAALQRHGGEPVTIYRCEKPSATVHSVIPIAGAVTAMCFSSDATQLFIGDGAGNLSIYLLGGQAPLQARITSDSPQDAIHAIAVDQECNRAAVAHVLSGTVLVDLHSRERSKVRMTYPRAHSVCFTQDSSKLIQAEASGRYCCYDLATGNAKRLTTWRDPVFRREIYDVLAASIVAAAVVCFTVQTYRKRSGRVRVRRHETGLGK